MNKLCKTVTDNYVYWTAIENVYKSAHVTPQLRNMYFKGMKMATFYCKICELILSVFVANLEVVLT